MDFALLRESRPYATAATSFKHKKKGGLRPPTDSIYI